MKNFEKLTTEEILEEIELLDNSLTHINNEIINDKLKEIALIYINYLKPLINIDYHNTSTYLKDEFIKEITKK